MKIFDWAVVLLLVLTCGLSVGGFGSVTDYESKDSYVDAAQGQVAQWRRRVAQLKTERAYVATDSERFRALDRHIATLERNLTDVENAVEKLQAAEDRAWIRGKRNIDRELATLERTHEKWTEAER